MALLWEWVQAGWQRPALLGHPPQLLLAALAAAVEPAEDGAQCETASLQLLQWCYHCLSQLACLAEQHLQWCMTSNITSQQENAQWRKGSELRCFDSMPMGAEMSVCLSLSASCCDLRI